jgi:predicted CXXCH cytochrome family protein
MEGMKFVRTMCCLLVMLCLVLPAGANPYAASLVEPADKSVVIGKWLPVVIVLDGDADRVVVTRNKKVIAELCPSKGRKYLCTTIAVDFGLNEIGVEVTKGELTIEIKKITVFYRSDISKKAEKAPPGFQSAPFHSEAKEQVCRPCHDMEADQSDARPERPELSSCYRCHSKITSYGYVHGPSAVWTCFACHDRHSTPFKYATPQPDRVICFTCHSDSKAAWAAKEYVHGPTATGKCTICHDPHASDSPFFLKKASWNLCVSCHEDRGKEPHVLNLYALLKIAHPTKGVKDPSKQGKMLSCASCHNPHASNSDKFLAFDIEKGNVIYDFCNKCHKK